MKILNLYACLGGNRYKWTDCQVTAVEIDPLLCELYQERFPDDKVFCGDAHKYLLDHFQEFDFIWSSPPCPSHSRARFVNANAKPIFPDLKLYEEIIFLENYFDGKYCVENVIPYYDPLIPGNKRGRHYFWTNFPIPFNLGERIKPFEIEYMKISDWNVFHEYDFKKYKGGRLDKIARNLVDFEVGKNILNVARQKKELF